MIPSGVYSEAGAHAFGGIIPSQAKKTQRAKPKMKAGVRGGPQKITRKRKCQKGSKRTQRDALRGGKWPESILRPLGGPQSDVLGFGGKFPVPTIPEAQRGVSCAFGKTGGRGR